MFDPRRRRLLQAGALGTLAAATGRLAFATGAAGGPVQARLSLSAGAAGRRVDPSLASLSYETLQLADPAFFSAGNHGLVRLFRELNPHGVLRIGGNTSDYTVWSGYRGALPAQPPHRGGPQQPFVLRPQALHTLAGFLRATGWKLVFGVNLRIGVPAMAAMLARAVQDAVGDDLLAIQIGNEANNYEVDYAAFEHAWTPYAEAIAEAGVAVAGPDTGANTDWVIEYARRHGADNVFLSRHYYRDAAPRGSIPDLLGGDSAFLAEVEQLVRAGDACGRPVRLTEANSYYFGGRDGVSNVFASALWGADFMLALAQRGIAGIHFHGGTLASVEASLGRTARAADGGDLHARRDAVSSRYSAIAGDVALGFQPRPLYHGLRLAQRFADARLLQADLDAGGADLTAYAGLRADVLQLALINKDAGRDVSVALQGVPVASSGRLWRLHAPTLDSRRGVAFEAAGRTETDARGHSRVHVPRGSAAYLEWQRSAREPA